MFSDKVCVRNVRSVALNDASSYILCTNILLLRIFIYFSNSEFPVRPERAVQAFLRQREGIHGEERGEALQREEEENRGHR